ncbi:hypothetical protein [Paractinoplanes toevensis]|uniref:Uncharacterized protein n=1 Tax=Paractinoplanes toevensis TaxID=571911 RepID=A0A919W4Z2_9ACTN|nr:hypothetical protein [Actinoplanes toevensis]GIM92270.1 hypothetical protein Ato02nite_040630 [Actinoplanes toevensis]
MHLGQSKTALRKFRVLLTVVLSFITASATPAFAGTALRRILRKASVFLAVVVSLIAVSATPAAAGGFYYRNYYFFGSSPNTLRTMQGDISVWWDPGSPRHLDVAIHVYIDKSFETYADRCAMKLAGQLMDLNGNVWNVPDVAFTCNEALDTIGNKGAGDSLLRHSLISDTNAAWIRPYVCVYLYYTSDPTVSKCAGDGAWMQYNGG